MNLIHGHSLHLGSENHAMLKAANIQKNAKLGEIEPESEAFQLEASPRVFFEIGIFKKFCVTHRQNIFMAVDLTIGNISTIEKYGQFKGRVGIAQNARFGFF